MPCSARQGAGDIGRHFPDTDPAWKGANSIDLLRKAMTIVTGRGIRRGNVDVVVIAQQPKLVPHIDAICANLAAALDCDASQISVKGKTNEGRGLDGRGGIDRRTRGGAVASVALNRT